MSVYLCLCFSDDETTRLSSVVMSADVIKAASLPLQLDQPASNEPPHVAGHKIRKRHKRKRRVDCCEADELRVLTMDSDSIGDQRNSNKSCKQKLKGQAEVNHSESVVFCNTVDVRDNCLKVTDSGSKSKCHKHKHKRTSDSFVSCDSDGADQGRVAKRKKM